MDSFLFSKPIKANLILFLIKEKTIFVKYRINKSLIIKVDTLEKVINHNFDFPISQIKLLNQVKGAYDLQGTITNININLFENYINDINTMIGNDINHG